MILSDRESVLTKNARFGKNRITGRTIVIDWEYKLTLADYENIVKSGVKFIVVFF